MASSFECLGLTGPGDDTPTALNAALARLPDVVPVIARTGGLDLVRYDDPSGARLTLVLGEDDDVVELVPSYAGPAGADFTTVTGIPSGLVIADIEDDDGLTTRMVCELAERRLLPDRGCSGSAALTAFAHDVVVHANVAAYVVSLGDGLPWGPESFLPSGLFGDGPATASARLSGTVLESGTHRVELTGLSFHRARVRSAGFEAELVLSTAEHPDPPPPGAVVTGTVYVVAEMPQLLRPRRRRWFGARRS